MARALTLGNGTLLVGIDSDCRVRDLYFPYVGEENHLGPTSSHRLGVFADGTLSWVGQGNWSIEITCNAEMFRGESVAVSKELGLELNITDVVYNELPIFLRKVTLRNTRNEKRNVKVFFTQQFVISESLRGDTGYFDPKKHSIIHYKGHRAFLIHAECDGKPFEDYTTGLYEIEGKEGSHRDAEDGALSKNPIEHGKVDSAVGIEVVLSANGEGTVHYWLAAGKSIEQAGKHHLYVKEKSPEHLIESSGDYWKAWVNRRNFTFKNLSPDIISLFKKSLFAIRAHSGGNGAIIASSDSEMLQYGRDTYTYVWPRDAALTVSALSRAGEFNVSRHFFKFASDIMSEEGYFMHKYRPDGSLGSSWHPWIQHGKEALPIQEDETSLVIWSLWTYYSLSKDIELIEELYNPLIKKAALFLMSHADVLTGLSWPSYDLWEEKYGIHTYTAAAKYGALQSAARFAEVLGKLEEKEDFLAAADKIKKAIFAHLYDEKTGNFHKGIAISESGKRSLDKTLDSSSAFGIWHFRVLSPSDPIVGKAIRNLEKRTLRGYGLPRYETDRYFRSEGSEIPNTWVVTSLWRARHIIACAKSEDDLEEISKILEWVEGVAHFKNSLPEQIDPVTGAALSATPLIWSHAEFVKTVIDYLEKLESLGICKACYPLN